MNRLKMGDRLCGGALICALLLGSCNKETEQGTEPQTYGGVRIALSDEMPEYVMQNLDAYVFNGNTRTFSHKLSGVTKDGNRMTAKINTGRWDMMLLSRTTEGTAKLNVPTLGAPIATTTMWEAELDDQGMLKTMPDLLYANTGIVDVQIDQTAAVSTTIAHNMALIKVKIIEAYGFDISSDADNTITLGNVPTTLSWEGKLLPNTTSPSVGKMRSNIKFNAPQGVSYQQSEPVEFMIPAHRGVDWELETQETDTLKQLLTVSVNLKKADGNVIFLKENVKVLISPKMNRQMQINLRIKESITLDPIVVTKWVLNDVTTDPY